MTVHLHWFLPHIRRRLEIGAGGGAVLGGQAPARGGIGQGRGRGRRGRAGMRGATIDYLAQVARAAEQNGFEAVLTPTGTCARTPGSRRPR